MAKSGLVCLLGSAGAMLVYRQSQVKAAGFDTFPKNTDDFLKLLKKLKENGTPVQDLHWAMPPVTASGVTG
jgi:multiple sugar transport system substrate-binding protein